MPWSGYIVPMPSLKTADAEPSRIRTCIPPHRYTPRAHRKLPASAEAATNWAVGVNGTTAEPKMRMATSMVTVGLAAVATGGLVLALAEGGGCLHGPLRGWGGGCCGGWGLCHHLVACTQMLRSADLVKSAEALGRDTCVRSRSRAGWNRHVG